MKHWHRCKRWERFRLRCPFAGLPPHVPDEDEDDEEEQRGEELPKPQQQATSLAATGIGVGTPMEISLTEAVIKERLIEAEVAEHEATKQIVQTLGRTPRAAMDVEPRAAAGGSVVPTGAETPAFARNPIAATYAALLEAAVWQPAAWYETLAESTVLPAQVAVQSGVKAVASVRRADTQLAELGVAKTASRFDEFGEIGVRTGVLAAERAMGVAEEVTSAAVTRAIRTPLTARQLEYMARRHNIPTVGSSVPDTWEASTAVRPFPKAGQGRSPGQVIRFPNVVPRILGNMRAAVFP